VTLALYAATLQVVNAIPDNADRISAAQPILQGFIDGLDDLNGSGAEYLMDTLRREEASDAFDHLAEKAGVPAVVAQEWFDSWRNF
jgi:hypothetical protein